ncbi:MAG: alpha/beta fold hydrolase, partial [Rhodospirillales bacterium]|nr:alpha/beta fold hydrolase [Rhodospirillales bacterium]
MTASACPHPSSSNRPTGCACAWCARTRTLRACWRRRPPSAASWSRGWRWMWTRAPPSRACSPRWKRRAAGGRLERAASPPPSTGGADMFFDGFELRQVAVPDGALRLRIGGSGPPLLLLHGNPQTHAMWHRVVPDLARRFTVICPDLRGHGDSAWNPSGHYAMADYVYDLAQLIHQQALAPVSIIAHSLGGNVALRTTGVFPEAVRKLVAIEGLGPGPRTKVAADRKPVAERIRGWVEEMRAQAGRQPRRYASIEQAFARMQEANPHLSAAQARHLTEQGVNQNEDGTYTWKFDPYVRLWPPYDMTREAIADL